MLEEKRCEVPIFTEREEILLVKRVDDRLGVFLDDTVRDDDRTTLVRGTDAVHGETTGQTRHRSEQTLEGLGQVMRDIVLVYLHVMLDSYTEVWTADVPGSSSTTSLPRCRAWSHSSPSREVLRGAYTDKLGDSSVLPRAGVEDNSVLP